MSPHLNPNTTEQPRPEEASLELQRKRQEALQAGLDKNLNPEEFAREFGNLFPDRHN